MDIETATHDELLDELERRYPSVLLVTERDALGRKSDRMTEFNLCYRGPLSMAIGLAQRATHRLCAAASRSDEDVADDSDDY
jgi:hypothetical protein